MDGPALPVWNGFRAWRYAMKQYRKTKHVDVNTFDNWADFTLKGFVGKKPDGYTYRDDGWDTEASEGAGNIPREAKETKK